MCNINFIYNKRKRHEQRVTQFMNHASYESFRRNKDGEGFLGWNNRFVVSDKSFDKIRYNLTNKFWAILSHQRYATSGFNLDNVHPYRMGELSLMHNGVISGLGNKEISDTNEYFADLYKIYVKNGKKIAKAIKKVSKKHVGSYSVFIFNHRTNRLYYYKNHKTSMFILNNRDWLVMSTIKTNLEFAKDCLKIKGKIKEVKDERVYDVFNGFKVVGKFTNKNVVVYYSNPNKSDQTSLKPAPESPSERLGDVDDSGEGDYYMDMETNRWVNAKTGDSYDYDDFMD